MKVFSLEKEKGLTTTTLGRTKVFARSWCPGTATTSLLNAQRTALNDLTLQTLLSSICLICGNHIHEAKATRLLAVGIHHNGAVVDITVFLEQARDIRLGQTRVNTSDEEV